ncbi:ABC transporter ATP-binding protein [Nitrincola sp. MINF-07-Sa-05]|uniref:ABC transporter ATP-binding protein n=1 Tax=Nitrincola salilacus TaxID=3400273 RepID=UPI003918031B
MSDLNIKNLKKVFEGIEIIKGVDLEIKDHEFVVFVGPSGCGKSTLLRLIAGLEEVTSGQIFLDNNEITDMAPAKRDLAMVFQTYALYPHMTVRKNMSFALDLAGIDKREIDAKVSDAARILELEPLLERKPKALSGGQRQRVAIGRAIVRQPKIFLFDEPLSNLDAALRVQMRLELARLHQELSATMIYVTHDQVEAMTLASKVVVLNAGRVEQVGSPLELYHHPVNRFVAGFIGTPKMGFMEGRVVTANTSEVTLTLGCGHQLTLPINGEGLVAGGHVTLGVRPEHLSITSPEESGLLASLTVSEHLGADTFCYVEMAAGELLTVRAGGDFQGQYGSHVGLKIDLSQCHLFDEDGLARKRIQQTSTTTNHSVAI